MFLQRLTHDDTSGFNYDHMGSAEYEFGVTRDARTAMAKLFISDGMKARAIDFVEKIGKNESSPVLVLALGSEETLDKLGNPAIIQVTKEPFRTSNRNINGWMLVDPENKDVTPLMLLRVTDDVQERLGKFLKDPIAALREEAA